MCGIVGYIGRKKAIPILLDGLAKLEYRGYDSSGIALLENNKINIYKDKGRVKKLYEVNGIEKNNGNIGIAHTRWATHGKPSKENAHPHIDNNNSIAVVHNGIIENYLELKKFLKNQGYEFHSETDTEIIPNLINYYYKTNKKNIKGFLNAVKQSCDKLIGSYAIEILSEDFPDNMIIVRKDSPLVIGKGNEENYVASDIPAILGYTKKFYLLENSEYAILSREDIKFYNNELQKIEKKPTKITWSQECVEKNGFEDYMLKEIYEQPNSIRETIGTRIENNKCNFDELDFTEEYMNSLEQIYIVACGTAMHAGLAVKNTIEKFSGIHTEVDIASEFRYRDPIINKNTLCICISQSGETADTIAALKISKEKNAKTIAVTNVMGSSITREADYTIYTHAGPEIAVASTKAYTSQIVILTLLAIYFAQVMKKEKNEEIEEVIKEVLNLPNKIEEILKDTSNIKNIAKQLYTQKDIYYLGRGIDYMIAQEASLKLKEISYIHCESYAAGELKHGTIALIEKGINAIGIITDELLLKKTISNIEEIITRGAEITIIINKKLLNEIDKKIFKNIIIVPDTKTFISPIISIIPLQILAYFISKEKGLDVDKPRNLAKSVTVE